MTQYQDDILYQVASSKEVHSGLPSSEEGSEGDERWASVDGKGLYHCKKYGGQWNTRLYSDEVLEENESPTTGVITSITSSTAGLFDTLVVDNSTTLQTSTTISGTLDVSGDLGTFPTSGNLKIINNDSLDTIQDIKVASSPEFTNLTLTGNIQVPSATTLASVNSVNISNTQWGYVGNQDQATTTASDVAHAKLSLTDSAKTWIIDPENSGHLRITTDDTDDAAIIIGSGSNDDHTLKNHGYVSGLFTGEGWSIYEDDNRHKIEVDDLSVRGTLSVYELLIQQIRATNGSVFITSAAKLETDGNALFHIAGGLYILTFQSDEDSNKPHPFANNDLILARRVDTSGDNSNVVSEVRFTVNDITSGNANQLNAYESYSSITLPSVDSTSSNVLNGMDFVRVGNTTDSNRRGGIYLTSDDTLAPFIDIFDEVSSWQEWDGITNIFGLSDGSFDLATTGTYSNVTTIIPGSSWYSNSTDSANVQITADGGIGNYKYCKLDRNDSGTSYIYQTITFPYISSGNYKVTIEWYGKQYPISAYEPRIACRWSFPSGASGHYFKVDGTLADDAGSSLWDWEDITSPASQPTPNTVWHKYQWELTVPSTMFSGTDNKIMYLVFATANAGTSTTAWVDNVSITMQKKVKARIGRLEGVGGTGYGLWAENAYLKGRIEADEGYIGNEYAGWRIESTGLINEADASYISAGQGASVGYENPGTYLDGTGKLFLGDATSYLKFDGDETLTLSGTMVAGIIQSENLTSSTGTKIDLSDGSMTTKGTSTTTGLVIASDGSISTNGATIDGGTITGTLMQSAFAEGDVDFVTEYIGAATSAYYDVLVNGVNRLKCNRVCDNVFQEFSLNSNNSASAYHTKALNIWLYDYAQPAGGNNITALNRVAGPPASTNVTVNMNSFPMISYDWFCKNETGTAKDVFAMRFRIENTKYHFFFKAGVRVDDDGGGDGGECHMGFMGISADEWDYLVAQSDFDLKPENWDTPNNTWNYNILDHDGEGGTDEGDYGDANTVTVSCGSYTFICWGEIRHEQEGTDNTLIASLRIFMTGTGAGMEDSNDTLTRCGIDLKKLHSGANIVDRSVMFPEGFFRVYN